MRYCWEFLRLSPRNIKNLKLVDSYFKEIVNDIFCRDYFFDATKVEDYYPKEKIKKLMQVDKDTLNQLANYRLLAHLVFSNKFNSPIDKDILPDSLVSITFGDKFNYLIHKNVFPNL